MDKGSSRVEAAYAGKANVIKLENVPCELTFKAAAAYVEHEDEKHHYLPCFKLRGIIDEVRGDFPYHISCVYFADDDQPELTKTISYYPSPKELAHMIEVGGFYSRRFAVPDVISENTYSFPALVDMTIVPPPNPAAYEAAAYDPMADAMDLSSVNLPVVYVRLKGSGVTRKTDPLLDYYDVDLDDSFQMFAMTAESSGYREPQLLEYITEPESEPEAEQMATDVVQRVDDVHYITPEEEAQLLSGKDTSFQKEMEDVEPAFKPANPEDALLLKTSDEIAHRVREKHGDKVISYDKVFGNRGREHQDDLLNSRMHEMADKTRDKVLDAREKTGESEKVTDKVKVNETTTPSFTQDIRKVSLEPIAKPVSEPEKPKRPSFSSIIMTEAAARAAERRNKLTQPDVPQQQADVKMDFNPEANEFVKKNREDSAVVSNETNDKDMYALQDVQGADVADAREQAKVDDQHAIDLVQDVARAVQQAHADVDVKVEKTVDSVSKELKSVVKATEEKVDKVVESSAKNAPETVVQRIKGDSDKKSGRDLPDVADTVTDGLDRSLQGEVQDDQFI